MDAAATWITRLPSLMALCMWIRLLVITGIVKRIEQGEEAQEQERVPVPTGKLVMERG